MEGDDAIEFFSALAERFSVDLSTLECHRFFRGEADISSPFSWIAGWIAPERNARIPVSVRHLVTVVEDGRWHDPTPAAV